MSRLKIGINGFGRIGRLAFRAGFDDVEIVGINNLGGSETAAHLLKYDSTHGQYTKIVECSETELVVDGKSIHYSSFRNPEEIPWGDWGADIVFECTGVFTKKADALKHKSGGAKKVMVSAPSPDADLTVVYGINHELYNSKAHDVISNASCTTNCLAPIAKVINDTFGIEKGMMTTVHSYTNDQMILDAPHKDLRRARAAAMSMIPTTTGAAKAVGLVLPDLKGKIDGIAVRVPTADVSLVDLVVETKKSLTKESLNEAFAEAASGQLKGILRCENKPLVSIDFVGDTSSSIVDVASTMVMGDRMAKVFSWYDNEMGFSRRMIDLALYMADKGMD
ncbi:MAG: type I glyceraldehyde-3-phosphate dehydrogenase [Pseudobdellovibrionaceae bacterium]|nr:type I glyceraldehyde-3-phosphate dehydrogenase [Bdellovibrionales bacterium]USN48858.1 MAG: type I glyceraldehyde-3-phosphate dehydrogenase [Pseudobdellovibrionaceae bacterium]